MLSVGELQDRKNQRVVIKALHELNNPDIYYWAVGKGELFTEYQQLIEKYGLKDKVTLLGFRTDIVELCGCGRLLCASICKRGIRNRAVRGNGGWFTFDIFLCKWNKGLY